MASANIGMNHCASARHWSASVTKFGLADPPISRHNPAACSRHDLRPPVLRAIANSQYPQCGSRMATPLLSARPDYPCGDHVPIICDACAQSRVVSIGPPSRVTS